MYFSNYLITIPCQKVFRQSLKILEESNRNLSYFGTNPPRFIAQRGIFGPNSPLLQIRFLALRGFKSNFEITSYINKRHDDIRPKKQLFTH